MQKCDSELRRNGQQILRMEEQAIQFIKGTRCSYFLQVEKEAGYGSPPLGELDATGSQRATRSEKNQSSQGFRVVRTEWPT